MEFSLSYLDRTPYALCLLYFSSLFRIRYSKKYNKRLMQKINLSVLVGLFLWAVFQIKYPSFASIHSSIDYFPYIFGVLFILGASLFRTHLNGMKFIAIGGFLLLAGWLLTPLFPHLYHMGQDCFASVCIMGIATTSAPESR